MMAVNMISDFVSPLYESVQNISDNLKESDEKQWHDRKFWMLISFKIVVSLIYYNLIITKKNTGLIVVSSHFQTI